MFAKLDDHVLNRDSGASWSISAGVAPYMGSFVCDKNVALDLVENAEVDGSTLVINDGNGTEMKFEKLTVLRAAPTTSPHEFVVHVVDSRWKWSRKWVKRSYNMRRRTGSKKKLAKETLNLQEFQPDITYQTWSLKDGKPWTAIEVLEDILKVLVGSNGEVDLSTMKDTPIIEGLEIDSPGDVALGRVFSVLGNMMSVYLDQSGKAKVFDVFSGKEGNLVGISSGSAVRGGSDQDPMDLVVGYPTWMVQDRHIERPVKVRVLFTRALEVRFDHKQLAPNVIPILSKTREKDKILVDPELENVIAVPEDVKSTTPASPGQDASTTTYPAGSYIPITTYLDFLSGESTPSSLPPLTVELVNNLWMQGILDSYSDLDPSGLWARRIAAIRMHYRRVYRVKRPYSERIRLFSSRRVKLQDAETDGYLASPAYFDYAAYKSFRGLGLNKATDLADFGDIVKNKFAFKNNFNKSSGPIVSSLLGQLDPAPANIRMIDPVLGIFLIEFYQDLAAESTKYVHSALTQIPTEDPKGSEVWLQDASLSPSRELSVVLTTFPAAPNDNRQLYAVDIMADTSGNLGQRAYTRQKSAKGPTVEVRVMPGVAMARYQWPDNKAKGDSIKRWFAEALVPSDEEAKDATEDNAIFGLPINPEELQAVAAARAREIFAMYTDHLDGGATTNIRPGVSPVGTVKEVVHSAHPDGALTSVTFPADPPRVDLGQLMPASVRKLVNRDEPL